MVSDEEFRAAGYTAMARDFPMDDFIVELFAAFTGVRVDQLPEAFKYHPNQWSADAWRRVAIAALSTARAEALEEAAKEMDAQSATAGVLGDGKDARVYAFAASQIRALKAKP